LESDCLVGLNFILSLVSTVTLGNYVILSGPWFFHL
jgi:hypothetical protein